MSSYIHTPKTININDIEKKDYNLSSSQYKGLAMPNNNYKLVKEFLSRKLNRKDLGIEVGSLSYIDKSPYFFIRTKALQEHSYLPNFTNETALPIMPSEFVQMNLKEGDLLISKDSNIGEIVILDKDYPNHMLSGAIYKLPVNDKWKYYLLAFIKHNIFREQLDFMVPKGATIRHAKTMFLDCKIPLPKNNMSNVVKYISLLTQAIINKEKLIRIAHDKILHVIDRELKDGYDPNTFTYQLPTYNNIKSIERLDVGIYSELFQRYIHIIHNYKHGYSKDIYSLGFSLSRGQNLQESNIGKSIYTDQFYKSFYTLALPTHFSEYGTINKITYLGNRNTLKTLNKGELVFGAEGTFRSFLVCDDIDQFITNIHGITLKNDNLELSIFVKLFLDYLANKGVIDCVKVGGHGGSFAQKYWSIIPFPKFCSRIMKDLTAMYHSQKIYCAKNMTLDKFMEYDHSYNTIAGIYELDKSAKYLQQLLNRAIDDIVNDRDVRITFDI